jgi:hypothetical protein
MNKLTDYLFSTPSWLDGFARALDMGGTMTSYNSSDTPAQADAIALYTDWKAVSQDWSFALDNLDKMTT